MKRMGMVIAVKPEKLDTYRQLHANPWPEMNEALHQANIRNYSIFLDEGEMLLFGVWDYAGSDYESDMRKLGEKDVTRRWLALTDPCQTRLRSGPQTGWWSMMEQVFHLD